MLSSNLNKQAQSGSPEAQTQLLSKWICWSAIRSTIQPNMLRINSDQRGNNSKFEIAFLGKRSFGSEAVVLYQLSCHLYVPVDTNQPQVPLLLLICLDHPEGITIQPSTAIEGDDITLTCQAARYFFTTIQWLDSFNRTVTTNLSSLQVEEHSISQSLRLHSVSPNNTRGYKCQARQFNNKVELMNAALIVDGRLC